MKVRAKRKGYYGNQRRYEGDIFLIKDEKAFSDKWMEKVSGKVEVTEPVKLLGDASKVEEAKAAEALKQKSGKGKGKASKAKPRTSDKEVV